MSHVNPEERFRQAAEAENGMPISAGARLTYAPMPVAAERSLHVDLSDIPESERMAVVAEIKALVDRASTNVPGTKLDLAQPSGTVDG